MTQLYLASFDIGKKNFSFCIEKINKEELSEVKNIPENERYNSDGTPTDDMNSILEQVYSNGKIILHKNNDLTKNCDKKQKLDPESFHNLNIVLDKYTKFWDKCNVFIIEQQMAFGSKVNLTAIKLAQHCYSYFNLKYGRLKQIIDYPSFHKTQILGAPKVEGKKYKSGKIRYKAMDQRQRKKWSVEKAIEIATCRGEVDIVDNLTVKKADDLADVICQLESAKYLIYVDKKI